MVDNNFEYKEEGTYESEGNSVNEIILRHIRKIGDLCCQELTGSYWDKKPIRTQSGIMFSEVYHQDLREAYCNSVDFLIDIIYPAGDDQLRTYLNSHEDIDKEWGEDIKGKVKQKRKTFKEINKMFQRTNFWQSSEAMDE